MIFMEICDIALDSQNIFSSITTFPDFNFGSLYDMPYDISFNIFSDFHPERKRQYNDSSNSTAHKRDKLIITEYEMAAFKKCYENGK